MSYETNKEKNGMGTQIFITIYIPNSFIVNILSPREGKRLQFALFIKKKIKQNVYRYFKFKADLFYQTMFRKIYIQLICIAKTRNGKLVALA
jgi:hypothetical protein